MLWVLTLTDWRGVYERYQIDYEQLKVVRKELLVRQGFRCGACGRDLSKKQADLDHSHSDHELRGLLCSGPYGCNAKLGLLEARDLLRLLGYVLDPPARAYLPDIISRLKAP